MLCTRAGCGLEITPVIFLQKGGQVSTYKKALVLLVGVILLLQAVLSTSAAAGGNTFYISPTGNDGNSGTSETAPWATFNRAWKDIYPGDTLILLDGVYNQSLNPNKRNGEAGKPITIKAKNDGKAIIDGQHVRVPVKLGDTWPGPIGQHFVIEGIVAQNSSEAVFQLENAQYNTLRRVSGYNANTDTNHHVFSLNWADNNVIEDCIAAGTGRKMILVYQGNNNIIRRCLADWRAWEGRDFCGVTWPNGGSIQIYNASYNIIENSISYGPVPKWSTLIQANSSSSTAIGNKILGSISINAGMNSNGSVKNWGSTRPQPTSCTGLTDFNWPSHRAGFVIYGQGEIKDNLLQDIFSWGNAGLGLAFHSGAGYHPNNRNNRVNRATVINNGLDNPDGPWGSYGGIGTDALQEELSRFSVVENSNIENILIDWPNYYDGGQRVMTSMSGEGARLTDRYINGVLTNQPLWPWPMQGRIQTELGIDITGEMQAIISGTGPSPNYDLNTSPSFRAIGAGQSTTVAIDIQSLFGFNDTVNVTLSSPSADLDLSSTSFNINSPYKPVTVTLTDLNDSSFSSQVTYQIVVTANGGGITKNATINLSVNGGSNDQVFLPIISK
jgi:hypothetical protein